MNMEIYPAIDLREGRVVRLAQGDYARQTLYPLDPLQLACEYLAAGARWLHVVDLDGARAGQLRNLRVIMAIADSGLALQAGGGVRDEGDLQRLFDAGVSRVVVGSVAVTEPDKVEKWILRHGPDRLCIALDTRSDDNGRWTLPVRGWTSASAMTLDELAPRYAAAGARHMLCTDIACDGMLSGPNLDLYKHLGRIAPELAMLASGGVRDAQDLCALRALGLAGAVLGRALLEGRMTLAEALSC
ncbi:MAG: 1-(5-phosphoribosyl)-5-[(5-phosphoribosylamino)methylideneamino] imidazole-4-carboxamide isomerase [Rudaea sp.]|nr:1-(5-phosphoribosyl)-5-[(5-phosphoribosylamino)methylideneamino] imidazole-4-carboxamide isomerase [Rudaea sp.]